VAVNVSNIDIIEPPRSLFGTVTLSRRSTSDSFSVGDLVSDSTGSYGGTCDVVASADKSQFIGVSNSTIDGSTDTTSKVNIFIKAVIRAPLKSGASTIYFGECGAYDAGGNGTTWYLDNTATEAIVHCVSESITAGKYGRWLVDPFTVRAVTGIGFFELPA